ncbi:MAG TPA: acyl-CoA dehydrogenase [Myxococcaceae bacterium]|nr:acyl-CoA dehydrogenase [Myxococcaceae bacterium]
MNGGINRYLADLRELQFVLLEQFRFGEIAGRPPFEAWGADEAKAVLEETYRFVREELGPLNSTGDREGCRLEGGQVYTPKGFKDAWRKLYETGFKIISVRPELGGQGAPHGLQLLIEELLSGSNPAFNMYPGLAFGAAELIAECGTPAQVRRYAEKMFAGVWGGTMCLTEPQAGSDVGAAQSIALKNPDGTYRIRGTKIFISGGDHDLTENIIHLVLARVENAPPGTKGLSLFIVPKKRINADGSTGPANDVQVGSIEHKMGINGSATCVLNFGENDQCRGELVGGVENAGMSQMFRMMNGARIAVAVQGLGVLSTAYLNALAYAKERKQGANFKFWKDPTKPRVPIIEHPDVRRMLLEMKANTEGIRALLVKLTTHVDRSRQLAGVDDEKANYHRGQVELLTPIVKSYSSDTAFRLCAQAIQVYGGAGYLRDHPVEQYCRDAKIFSIYEGTNHIQAMDLVGRKLGQAGGSHFQDFMRDVGEFASQHRTDPRYGSAVETLAAAQESIMQTALVFFAWSQSDKLQLIPLNAGRFLTLMSELAIGWLLLDAALISEKALESLPASHPDRQFYEGKRWSALWFARNVLPGVEHGARLIAAEDSSPMEISEDAFAA